MADWRQMAEELLKRERPEREWARDRMAYELRVHQVELQLQNEELRSAHLLLEQARDRYRELFDHAPIGYLNIDEHSRIVEANLAFAALLGLERTTLVGQRLPRYMDPADADNFHFHRMAVFRSDP